MGRSQQTIVYFQEYDEQSLNRKVFEMWVMPFMTYEAVAQTITEATANKLRAEQRAKERAMLVISIRNKLIN